MYVGSENIFQDQKTTRPAGLKELFSSFCILISSLICLSVCLPAFLPVSLSLCCMYVQLFRIVLSTSSNFQSIQTDRRVMPFRGPVTHIHVVLVKP